MLGEVHMKINEELSTYWPDIEPGSLCTFNEKFIKKHSHHEFDVCYGPGLKPFKKDGNFCYELKNYDWNYLLDWKERPIAFIKICDAFYEGANVYDTIFMRLNGKTYFVLVHHITAKNYRNLVVPIG